MTDNKSLDWVADATRAGTELRDAIREAHGALRDLRDTKREIEQVARAIPGTSREAAALAFAEGFKEAFGEYKESMTYLAERTLEMLEKKFSEAIRTITRQAGDAMNEVTATARERAPGIGSRTHSFPTTVSAMSSAPLPQIPKCPDCGAPLLHGQDPHTGHKAGNDE